ncbi:hypothetical protein [Vulcanococcus sp.]
MASDTDRRAKLLECIEIARQHGNAFLEANLRLALKELDKSEKGG